ncbi:hypothetical protein NP511_06935 [Natrinema thermotolerans]|uniref:Uncharacterized protein n=1 Tax=Natrinema thermotolerans TaxID=121872 RepID=A0AAF0PDT9_9EURY|nr:hypothetical protein [Natrinema thermotolerans]ELZ11381.1 hypothetical protein C478_13250 [Natrinema thermotolerans DSM 11552]QCC58253.1 hypothetical protein DVR14_06210 [Natrinema thermotolerans]WMT09366.1 hypothetical protein NP511_06935 [Natrinema thermotolerans]
MRTALRYHASMAIIGGTLGFMGLSTLASGTTSIPAVLLSIGGVGMVLATAYQVTIADDPSIPDDRVVTVVTVGAILTVLGGLLTLLS